MVVRNEESMIKLVRLPNLRPLLLKDVRAIGANCFWASLLRTQIHVAMAPHHTSRAGTEEDL